MEYTKMIDLSKIASPNRRLPLEPRDVFMSLTRDNQYAYPRDVQSEVWKQWFPKRDAKNTVIKMNTGSGKTVVGLTILQSCLNEQKEPAVYVVPDSYLVQQVCAEAAQLGIAVAQDEDDYQIRTNRAILVINIHKLVNGRSVFGLRPGGNNHPIGSIIIDDVHACIETIENQFTVSINSSDNHELYIRVVDLLKNQLQPYDFQKYNEVIEYNEPGKRILVPFWIWQDKCQDILNVLHEPQYSNESIVLFNLPLLQNCWPISSCIISANRIEITPKCIPVEIIRSFDAASRRIFMSATLSDDSVFVTTMGLKQEDFGSIITPDKANDIGERLIVFPQLLNPRIGDNAVKEEVEKLSEKYNVAVLVPSRQRAEYWQDVAEQVLYADNIAAGVDRMRTQHVGISIFVNKYDGIDLPDDSCRILVVDSLPITNSGYDSVWESMNPNSRHIRRQQIHRVEQGMGRGVRSNNDYCVVILMGNGLADVIASQNGSEYFSAATRVQYDLSKQLWDQMVGEGKTGVGEILGLAKLPLNRDSNWIELSRESLAYVAYDKTASVDTTLMAQRTAFDKAIIGNCSDAVAIIETERNNNTDDLEKGCLGMVLAEYENFINPVTAQEILLSAKTQNRSIITPRAGIRYEKLSIPATDQATSILGYIQEKRLGANEFLIKIDSQLCDLCFGEISANRFEEALKEICCAIGFLSSRPENEYQVGPDNLISVGNHLFLVVECKNRTSSETISESDCAQLNNSIVWFDNEYGKVGLSRIPVMIHHSTVFEKRSSPSRDIRIMDEACIDKLRLRIRELATSIAQIENWGNMTAIAKLICACKLQGSNFKKEYTVGYSQQL
ncbi:MAG: DEAD/DEAH box helicase family protein [Coriobacteriales bacterium]|jgi:hypothetical protein|nr:DEAD/DEAH box helicase family protein [Coriobacteriales bacterium]